MEKKTTTEKTMETEVVRTIEDIIEGRRWFNRFIHHGYEWKIEQKQSYIVGDEGNIVHLTGFDLEKPEKLAYAKTIVGVEERIKLADVKARIKWWRKSGKLGTLLSECGKERMGRVLDMLIEARDSKGYVDYTIYLNGERVCILIDRLIWKDECFQK